MMKEYLFSLIYPFNRNLTNNIHLLFVITCILPSSCSSWKWAEAFECERQMPWCALCLRPIRPAMSACL